MNEWFSHFGIVKNRKMKTFHSMRKLHDSARKDQGWPPHLTQSPVGSWDFVYRSQMHCSWNITAAKVKLCHLAKASVWIHGQESLRASQKWARSRVLPRETGKEIISVNDNLFHFIKQSSKRICKVLVSHVFIQWRNTKLTLRFLNALKIIPDGQTTS